MRGEAALLHTPAEPPEHPIVAALRSRVAMLQGKKMTFDLRVLSVRAASAPGATRRR